MLDKKIVYYISNKIYLLALVYIKRCLTVLKDDVQTQSGLKERKLFKLDADSGVISLEK